jgi:UDP-2,4-diacetamido-2,4,6-trideoxy-beta-L-altropyranose hydrolase
MNLLFRTDANVAMGTGHVMRCLALAQAWQDAGGSAIFAMAEATPAVEARLLNEGFEIVRLNLVAGTLVDANETARLGLEYAALWVVVDGYHFGADYQANLKSRGFKVLLIDDNSDAQHYSADLVLNQNVHAIETLYPNRDASTHLLLGPQYALLRRDFAKWRGPERMPPPIASRVLITMGGSDPDNLSFYALKILTSIGVEDVKVLLVAGGSNPYKAVLEGAIRESKVPIELISEPDNMAELMSGSDIALIAAGGTLWEVLFMGCAVCSFARNAVQRKIIECLENDEAVVNLDREMARGETGIMRALHELVFSPGLRFRLSRKGRDLVDGRGAERVSAALMGVSRKW